MQNSVCKTKRNFIYVKSCELVHIFVGCKIYLGIAITQKNVIALTWLLLKILPLLRGQSCKTFLVVIYANNCVNTLYCDFGYANVCINMFNCDFIYANICAKTLNCDFGYANIWLNTFDCDFGYSNICVYTFNCDVCHANICINTFNCEFDYANICINNFNCEFVTEIFGPCKYLHKYSVTLGMQIFA
jgi:hypothetical protein